MNSNDPISIASFHSESRRVRSGLLQRQYRLSATLIVLLAVACCTAIVTTRTASIAAPVTGNAGTTIGTTR